MYNKSLGSENRHLHCTSHYALSTMRIALYTLYYAHCMIKEISQTFI